MCFVSTVVICTYMIAPSFFSYINLEIVSNIVENIEMHAAGFYKQSLNIPKGQSESVYRRTDTMVKRKSTKGQTTISKYTHKTKDRVTRTPLKTGVNSGVLEG